MSDRPVQQGEPFPASTAEKLDSWKEIASHLGRSVRTVRRWEENEQLPVRRHYHGKGSTVFALRSELDAWLAARFESPRAEEAAASVMPTHSADSDAVEDASTAAFDAPNALRQVFRGASWAANWVAVAALTLCLAAAFWLLPDRTRELKRATPAGAVVVLADVDGDEDPEITAEVVSSLLRRELNRDPASRLMSRESIATALALMRRPAGAAVDADTAREIAWRSGEADALLIPKVRRVGDERFVDLDVVDPRREVTVAHFTEQFRSVDQLLSAVRRLASSATRSVAGRRAWEGEDITAPPRVTTSSREALRLYAEAEELRRNHRPVAAERLLRRAIDQDAEFASAHAQLAWTLHEQDRATREIEAVIRDAGLAATSVSAQEQLFVQASRDFFADRVVESMATFDALLTLDPTHYWGNRTAATVCWASGLRSESDCLRYPLRLADASPADVEANFDAAWALALWSDRLERADLYYGRARDGLAQAAEHVRPIVRARIELFPVFRRWLDGDLEGVVAGEREVAARFDDLSLKEQAALARELGYLALAMGRNRTAESWFRRLPDPRERHELLAIRVFTEDDPEALARHLQEGSGYRDPMTSLLFSMAGLGGESEELLARLEEQGIEDHYLGLGRGLNAMMSGDATGAIAEFESSNRHLRPDHRGLFFAGADLLAVARSKQGDLRGAVETLEAVASHRRRAAFLGSGVFWMKCQLRLAGFYREIGRETDAELIESQLHELLDLADDGYPMRTRLES